MNRYLNTSLSSGASNPALQVGDVSASGPDIVLIVAILSNIRYTISTIMLLTAITRT